MNLKLGYKWIYVIITSQIFLLFLPVYIYDKNLLIILAAAALIQIWFIERLKKDISLTKSLGLRVIPIIFAILNLISYQNRKDNFFEDSLVKKAEATIIYKYSQGGGRTTKRYFLKYRFSVNSQVFEHVDEVKYWVWFYYKFHDKLLIDYVVDNPKISRINKSSLIEQPNKDEIMKQANEEYKRRRLEKKEKNRRK
ncbi:hypothetical protein [Alkalitalea saponilacus]|nr:hypothetical protein [Alkalitalea saponilacus]ASB50433.1 hypothetical protein CDL62_15395 [Alkalitalea saponilacus]